MAGGQKAFQQALSSQKLLPFSSISDLNSSRILKEPVFDDHHALSSLSFVLAF